MRFLVLALCLGLGGCGAKLLNSNPRSVIVEGAPADVSAAQKIADAECSKHKRHAVLTGRPRGYSNEFLFDCVD